MRRRQNRHLQANCQFLRLPDMIGCLSLPRIKEDARMRLSAQPATAVVQGDHSMFPSSVSIVYKVWLILMRCKQRWYPGDRSAKEGMGKSGEFSTRPPRQHRLDAHCLSGFGRRLPLPLTCTHQPCRRVEQTEGVPCRESRVSGFVCCLGWGGS